MDEGKLLAGSYFLVCLVTLVGVVNNVVYLLLLKRLVRLLKERWPEKLADLGEPFYRFSSLRANLSSSGLLRPPGSSVDGRGPHPSAAPYCRLEFI